MILPGGVDACEGSSMTNYLLTGLSYSSSWLLVAD